VTLPHFATANVLKILGYGIGWIKDLLWSLAVGNQSRDYHVYKVLGVSGLPKEDIVNDVLALAVLATVELSMSWLLFVLSLDYPDHRSLRARRQLLP
jgi:hypothetical protein